MASDSDATPDLLITASYKRSQGPLDLSQADATVDILDDTHDLTVNILDDTQDLTVGTQKLIHTINSGLEVFDSESTTEATAAETMATIGDTVILEGSCITTENTLMANVPSDTQDLLLDSEVIDMSEIFFLFPHCFYCQLLSWPLPLLPIDYFDHLFP